MIGFKLLLTFVRVGLVVTPSCSNESPLMGHSLAFRTSGLYFTHSKHQNLHCDLTEKPCSRSPRMLAQPPLDQILLDDQIKLELGLLIFSYNRQCPYGVSQLQTVVACSCFDPVPCLACVALHPCVDRGNEYLQFPFR
jgi:hypothetical protein